MHCGQRLALIGITEKQNGHSFVDGGGGAAAGLKRLACRISMKITNAMIKKLITVSGIGRKR